MTKLSSRLCASVIVLAGASFAGCASDATAPTDVPIVGPSPLRRLTNREYQNALRDLFPAAAASIPELPPLPNDAEVAGFDNAAEAQQPSDVRIARYETVANLYAAELTRDRASVAALVGCAEWSTPSLANACATSFIDATGTRVFRRPLDQAEKERFGRSFQAWKAAIDFEGAVRLTLSTMLQAPQFLYRAEPISPTAVRGGGEYEPLEPYAMASRLSFFLWESVPDAELLAAASRRELDTDVRIRAQAERMLGDKRARRVLWNFHRQWLGLDRILGEEHFVRTPSVDPVWTTASGASAGLESRLFVEHILGEGGTFRDLFLSRRAWVNGEMARIYGLPAPRDPEGFTETNLLDHRAGILTRAAFLAGNSHRGATSPPIRGGALLFHVLCRLPASPPPDADLSMPVPTPGSGPQTNRMLFEARTAPAACQSCHRDLNAVGFGFESFDAAGAFHTEENGLPIDTKGRIYGTDVDRPYVGAVALSAALADSKTVSDCATRQWLRYALGRAPTDDERPLVNALASDFHATHGDVRKLLLGIVTAPTFRMRRVGTP